MESHDYIILTIALLVVFLSWRALTKRTKVVNIDLTTSRLARDNQKEIESLKNEVLQNSETLKKYELKSKKK